MQVFTYSGARFSPYGDEQRPGASDTPVTAGDWLAPRATSPLAARVSLPGSKSLTNRELVLVGPGRRAVASDAPAALARLERS